MDRTKTWAAANVADRTDADHGRAVRQAGKRAATARMFRAARSFRSLVNSQQTEIALITHAEAAFHDLANFTGKGLLTAAPFYSSLLGGAQPGLNQTGPRSISARNGSPTDLSRRYPPH